VRGQAVLAAVELRGGDRELLADRGRQRAAADGPANARQLLNRAGLVTMTLAMFGTRPSAALVWVSSSAAWPLAASGSTGAIGMLMAISSRHTRLTGH